MLEIERKFLVDGDAWRADVLSSTPIRQGYLSQSPQPTVRVRQFGDEAFLTIKGPTEGISRAEYEYPIPLGDALSLLETLCATGVLAKVRHALMVGEHEWTIDVFEGENHGLVLAEIELSSPEERFEMPDWAGLEVSEDPRYFNSSLVAHPFSSW